MVPIREEWTAFHDLNDQLEHYRKWGLIPPKSKVLRPIMVIDGYLGDCLPCKVVGYDAHDWAIIELADGFHAIHGEYLAELQPTAYQQLPRGICFAEILADYIVLDIETTGFNRHDDGIVEIAAIEYRYGRKVSEYHTMVNPEQIIPPEITALTGITQADVKNAPLISEVVSGFLEFIGEKPLIGHNAVSFDVPFLAIQMEIEIQNVVLDTLPMARAAFPDLPNHKLAYLKDVLRLSKGGSHRALEDVETTASLLWACLTPRRYNSCYWRAVLDAHTSGNAKCKKKSPKWKNNVSVKDIAPTKDITDTSSPLYGKNIVFTGDMLISRTDAMQMAADVGAIIKSTVSTKTHYLVVGKQDLMIVGMDGMSGKEEKAHMLNDSGKAQIKIISEKEFLDLLCPAGVQQETEITIDQTSDVDDHVVIPVALSDSDAELFVYQMIQPHLENILRENNIDPSYLQIKTGKAYSSVFVATQLAFRISAKDKKYYFGVAPDYGKFADPNLLGKVVGTDKSSGYMNFGFDPTESGIRLYIEFLQHIVDIALNNTPKEFDCCSRFEQCSDAKHCINPRSDLALGCGYRKIMRSGRIFYGKNRNID